MFRKGFTLMETVLYIAIISGVLVAFSTFLIMENSLKMKNREQDGLKNSANNIIMNVNSLVRNAKQILVPTPGATSTSLTLVSQDNSQKTIYLNSGLVYIDDNGISYKLLTGNFSAEKMEFKNLSGGTTNENIKLILELNNGLEKNLNAKYYAEISATTRL